MSTKTPRLRRTRRKAERQRHPLTPEIWGLTIAVAAGLALVCLYSDFAGTIGGPLAQALSVVMGRSAPWWLGALAAGGLSGMAFGSRGLNSMRIGGIVLGGSILAAWLHCVFPLDTALTAAREGFGGGMIGALISLVLGRGFGMAGRTFVLVAASAIAVLMIVQIPSRVIIGRFVSGLSSVATRFRPSVRRRLPPVTVRIEPEIIEEEHEPVSRPEPEPQTAQPDPGPCVETGGHSGADVEVEPADDDLPIQYEQLAITPEYELPPITLLNRVPSRPARSRRDVTERARLLEETLASFGVVVRLVGITQGPAVTRFEFQPAPGVKVSRIISLASDLALNLAAADVRIEAPIPGKAAIGIEVPNEEVSIVSLREVLQSPDFSDNPSHLAVGLGRDVSGRPIVATLDKLLHVLIAGATGSGKSVCINSLIASLLFHATPVELRMLLIDPKVVELSNYNGIPHLLTPVVTDPKQAAGCLRWAVVEMERRYGLFAAASVKDISKYNDRKTPVGEQPRERLPYLVIVIDELGDLMAVASTDVEDCIQRLAQMARAAGIYLLVATQRPSVDVITGVVKANIPTRIAFAVASGVDSRTILDMTGADRLVGRGDMLFLPAGASKPVRVQGAYVSDRELEALVAFWRAQGKPSYAHVLSAQTQAEAVDEDELLPQAARVIVDYGQASASLLQRRLRVGYARAARIIDQLEQRGMVGRHEGSKPREVRLSREEWQRVFGGGDE